MALGLFSGLKMLSRARLFLISCFIFCRSFLGLLQQSTTNWVGNSLSHSYEGSKSKIKGLVRLFPSQGWGRMCSILLMAGLQFPGLCRVPFPPSPPSLHMTFSLCVCLSLCPNFSFLKGHRDKYIRNFTGSYWIRTHLHNLILTQLPRKDSVSK